MVTKLYRAPFDLKLLDGAPEGTFRATFATLNVIDKDGDVTLPGAFIQGQPVKIAAWGHAWGDLTVGKGAIASDDQTAWVDGQFNLNTMAGREHYETVKFNGPEQEWSYGFEITNSSPGQFDSQDVRFLRALNVFECSPVMLGAGVGTRTDEIKAAAPVISDWLDVADAWLTAERDLKAGQPQLSTQRRERLAALRSALHDLGVELDALLEEATPRDRGKALWLECQRIRARRLGVAV
jgi:hypothetical protein